MQTRFTSILHHNKTSQIKSQTLPQKKALNQTRAQDMTVGIVLTVGKLHTLRASFFA